MFVAQVHLPGQGWQTIGVFDTRSEAVSAIATAYRTTRDGAGRAPTGSRIFLDAT